MKGQMYIGGRARDDLRWNEMRVAGSRQGRIKGVEVDVGVEVR